MAKYAIYKGFQDDFKMIAVAEDFVIAMEIKEALEAQEPEGGNNPLAQSVWIKEQEEPKPGIDSITFKATKYQFIPTATGNVTTGIGNGLWSIYDDATNVRKNQEAQAATVDAIKAKPQSILKAAQLEYARQQAGGSAKTKA